MGWVKVGRRKGNKKLAKEKTKRNPIGKKPKGISWQKWMVSNIPRIGRAIGNLKGLINSEEHYIDITADPVPSNAGEVQLISGIAIGDDASNRTGQQVLWNDLTMRLFITANATTGNYNTQPVRLILFMDHDNQGALPAVTDILQTSSAISFLNRANGKRFTVLHDRTYYVDNGNSGGTGYGDLITDKYYTKQIASIHGRFNGATSAVGDVRDNSMYILAIGFEGTYYPYINAKIRIGYHDN